MDIIGLLWQGFQIGLEPANLMACAGGIIIGTIVGVLPGIGPIGAISLLLPFSMMMDVTSSIIMFAGIYYGAMYGGSTTSILLNVPGEAASVVTCIDGYAMARKGRAGAALAVAAIGSFIAGTMGLVGLMLFAPFLANFALSFGPPEYFAIAVLGLIILTNLTGSSGPKSMLMALIGIMLGTIGTDSLTGINRLTFDIDELQRGVDMSIAAMGLFGLAEVFSTICQPQEKVKLHSVRFRELYPNREEMRRSVAPIFRGGVIGFLAGLIPGPAAVISTFVSYAVEKRKSRNPAEFGQGAVEGVAGPESANNAAASSAMIPLLSLGLPFAAASALLLTGFLMHGVTPGPMLISERPDIFWGLVASMYIGNVLLLIINLPLVGIFASILKIPLNILMPVVIIVTLTGTYALNNSIFDLFLVIGFGFLGFFMKRSGYEPAPLIIGLVLGPTIERGLVQGLIICNGDIWALIARPVTAVIFTIGMLIIGYSLYRSKAISEMTKE